MHFTNATIDYPIHSFYKMRMREAVRVDKSAMNKFVIIIARTIGAG